MKEEINLIQASHNLIQLLEKANENSENIVQDLPGLLMIVNSKNQIILANKSCANSLNLDPSDTFKRNISELFPSENWIDFESYISQYRNSESTVQSQGFECPIFNAEERVIKAFYWHLKHLDAESPFEGKMLLIIGEDISKLRDAEDQLKASLEDQVAERTKQIQEILNSIEQGIVTMNLDFTLNKEHSFKAEVIFESREFEDRDVFEVLQLDEDKERIFRKWLDFIKIPKKLRRWQKYVELLPNELEIQIGTNRKVISVNYQPIIKGTSLDKLMILVEDVTSVRLLEEEKERDKEKHFKQIELIQSIVSIDKEVLSDFLSRSAQYALRLADEVFSILDEDYTIFFRETHTLKGDAGTLGFSAFAKSLHILEEFLTKNIFVIKNQKRDEFDSDVWKETLALVEEEFSQIQQTRNHLFPKQNSEPGFFVERARFQEALESIHAAKEIDKTRLIEMLASLDSASFEKLVSKYNRLVSNYCNRYQKNLISLTIKNGKQLVKRDLFKIFDESLVHVIRNALDHGIESNKERENLMKGNGNIVLELLENENEIGILVQDDGRGIDEDLLLKTALKKGLVSSEESKNMGRQEKLDLLFMANFSSLEQATEISGRGVGMDAVASNLGKFGGRVTVQTELGKGTTISLWLKKT